MKNVKIHVEMENQYFTYLFFLFSGEIVYQFVAFMFMKCVYILITYIHSILIFCIASTSILQF